MSTHAIKNEVLGLGRFFTGKSEALEAEVKQVIQPQVKEVVDVRPEFIKRREAKLNAFKAEQQRRHDEDIMLFVNLVQRNKKK